MKPDNLIKFIKDLYKSKEVIPLHEPNFDEEEKVLISQFLKKILKELDLINN